MARLLGAPGCIREAKFGGLLAAEAVALQVGDVPGLHAAVIEAEPASRVGPLPCLLPHLHAPKPISS